MTRPSCLILTHRVPMPPNRGDRIRTCNFLRHIAKRADVWLGCLSDEPVTDDTYDSLRSLCCQVAIVPVEPRLRWLRAGTSFLTGRTISAGAFSSSRLRHIVSQWAAQTSFDSALCSSSALAPYLQIPELENTPRHVDLIDVDSEKWFDYAKASGLIKRRIFHLEGSRLRKLESGISDWASGITVVSEPEAQIYRSFRSDGPIQSIANGVDVDYFTPEVGSLDGVSTNSSSQSGCVFVGALDYKPNIDGITWFARSVWPQLRRKHSDQTLKIVGREPVAEVLKLSEIDGVEVVGTVPDIRPYLSQAAVAVVPLHIARGVQNKVLEALAMAKAVVASPDPLVGLRVEDGLHLLKAVEVEQWVGCVSRLLEDAELRREIGIAGQAYVTAHHRWEQCLEPLMRFLHLENHPDDGSVVTNTECQILHREIT
ncbi:MAG: TIGR03087 family PEP-CTERM/XrtA system glycosyltransferase [Rhodopirellula sp.]|nr:TIGR03087 family PEP-CTERM/XrtA system glycosyltransferase [Rhodopirellula sp.]